MWEYAQNVRGFRDGGRSTLLLEIATALAQTGDEGILNRLREQFDNENHLRQTTAAVALASQGYDDHPVVDVIVEHQRFVSYGRIDYRSFIVPALGACRSSRLIPILQNCLSHTHKLQVLFHLWDN